MPSVRRLFTCRRSVTSLVASTIALAAAPASGLADTSTSSNWSGYVAHRAGVAFDHVQASWRQPAAVCTRGEATYSSFWVGLGGYSATSNHLEQIGTELDCTAAGRSSSSAWYELVPSPSRTLRMRVTSGDQMSASVTGAGDRVTLSLTDRTRHESIAKRVTVASVDASSAEWILEAPSACTTTGLCHTLPLANFGSMGFTSASARTKSGHKGAIASSAWNTTRIVLKPGGRTFIDYATGGESTPSTLQRSATAFEVRYSQTSASSAPVLSTNRPARVDATVRPGGTRH